MTNDQFPNSQQRSRALRCVPTQHEDLSAWSLAIGTWLRRELSRTVIPAIIRERVRKQSALKTPNSPVGSERTGAVRLAMPIPFLREAGPAQNLALLGRLPFRHVPGTLPVGPPSAREDRPPPLLPGEHMRTAALMAVGRRLTLASPVGSHPGVFDRFVKVHHELPLLRENDQPPRRQERHTHVIGNLFGSTMATLAHQRRCRWYRRFKFLGAHGIGCLASGARWFPSDCQTRWICRRRNPPPHPSISAGTGGKGSW